MSAAPEKTHNEVVLMDPDRLFRESLAQILRNERFEVVQIAGSPGEVSLERLAQAENPILVADVQQNEAEVLKFFAEAWKMQPNLKIMVVTRSESAATVDACIEAGVHAYLSKNISSHSFQNYLSFVALDEKVMPIELAKSLRPSRHAFPSQAMPSADVAADFSPRERAILGHLVRGDSNKAIARRLGIADGTVKVGVKSILRKIKAANRTQAAIWALQHNFCEGAGEGGKEPSREDTVVPMRRNGTNGHVWREPENVAAKQFIQFEDVANPSY